MSYHPWLRAHPRWARGGVPAVRLRWSHGIIGLLLASPIFLIASDPASPLPLFSRKSGAPCARCHGVIPQLNRTGIGFAQAGYRDSSAGRLGSLRDVPVSVVGGADIGVSRAESFGAARPHFSSGVTGHEVEVLSAGRLMNRLAYQIDAGTTEKVDDA